MNDKNNNPTNNEAHEMHRRRILKLGGATAVLTGATSVLYAERLYNWAFGPDYVEGDEIGEKEGEQDREVEHSGIYFGERYSFDEVLEEDFLDEEYENRAIDEVLEGGYTEEDFDDLYAKFFDNREDDYREKLSIFDGYRPEGEVVRMPVETDVKIRNQ